MAGNDNWIYQGRQYHMWFGHGTRPEEDKPAPSSKDALPSLQDRIHNLGYTLAAGLPGSKRHHAIARLDTPDQGRLARVMTGVVHALPLGPWLIPIRVLGTNAGAPGVATFVKAGAALQAAHSNANLRNATDLVARSAQGMGLDRFRPFLRQADDHLAETGGMAALLRETAPAPAPLAAPRTPTPPGTGASPPLPPPGALMPLIGRLLRGTGWLVLAGTLLDGLIRANQEAQVRAAIERFKLDPSKHADMAAALAYTWARTNRSLLLGTSLPESAQDAVAEQVMRAVRADPALLDRAMAGDASALATIRAAVKATPTPGTAYEVRNDEERALVAQLISEGKSGTEIQTALDDLRVAGKSPTAEERRNTAGVAVMSKPLPRIEGPWLVGNGRNEAGAPIPVQVAEKLVGRSFPTFRALREAFWKAVANTPELSRQFSRPNLSLMRQGYSPYAPEPDAGQRSGVWELHHSPEVSQGGPVYDLSTIRVVTPSEHDAIHYGRN